MVSGRLVTAQMGQPSAVIPLPSVRPLAELAPHFHVLGVLPELIELRAPGSSKQVHKNS